MTVLVPMSTEAYGPYREAAVLVYAEDNVASGRWPEEGALARSQQDFDSLLPQGLATPNNHLFEIKAAEDGPTVGFIWFAVVEKHDLRSAFVYDVEIKPDYRRQGHATAAFAEVESFVRGLGLSSIGLHVFNQNEAALALYRKLEYGVTSVNMFKRLDVDGA